MEESTTSWVATSWKTRLPPGFERISTIMHDVCTLDPCDTIAQSVVSSMLSPQSTVFWTFQRQFTMVQCHVSSSQQAVLGTLYGLVQTLMHG
jgi:hypothetical protein